MIGIVKTKKGGPAPKASAAPAPLSAKSSENSKETLNKKAPNEPRTFPEVEKFLESVAMQKYLDTFIRNGFEDLETILELRDEDFTAMGVPLGHKLKMLKRIKELKPVEVKPESPPQPKLHGIQKNVEAKNEYVDLPAEKTDKSESKKENSGKKSVRFGESAVIIEIARETSDAP